MNNVREFLDTPPGGVPVRGFLHLPVEAGGDGLVLTHGAGANCGTALLVALAGAFCDAGWTVLRCDLPFRQTRPQGPPPPGSAERDQRGLKAALAVMRQQVAGRVYLGGHSYGGRQSSMLAAAEAGLVDALLLLSYPLHPPRRPAELRTAHFGQLQTPAMFMHGSRDMFGSIEEMTEALKLIPAQTELIAVTGAGHELLSKKNGAELPGTVTEAFRRFGAS
jgi:uncharacterized protein